MVTGYLSVIVLIPLAALAWEAHKGGLSGFWDAISSPEAVSAIELTLVASAIVAAVNAVAVAIRSSIGSFAFFSFFRKTSPYCSRPADLGGGSR